MAAAAALRDTACVPPPAHPTLPPCPRTAAVCRLPKLEVTVDDEGEHDVDIVDDVIDSQRLDPASIPLCVTLCQVSTRPGHASPSAHQDSTSHARCRTLRVDHASLWTPAGARSSAWMPPSPSALCPAARSAAPRTFAVALSARAALSQPLKSVPASERSCGRLSRRRLRARPPETLRQASLSRSDKASCNTGRRGRGGIL